MINAARTLALWSARPTGTAVLWVGLAVLYFGTAGWGSLSTDVIAAYVPAWSLGQHGTPHVDGFQQMSIWFREVDGHWVSDRFPGAILPAVPAYWLFGDASQPTVGPSLLTVAMLAASTVALMHRTLLRLVGPGMALAGAVVLAIGTPSWSIAADAQWTHAVTQPGIALMLYAVASRRVWVGAIGAALAAAARPHTAVVAAVLGLGDLIRHRRWSTAVALGLGALVGFAVVIGWSAQTLGQATLLPGTYTGRGGTAATAGTGEAYGWPLNLAGYLVSPERGLLVLIPFVVPCLVGAWRIWRQTPGWVRDAAIAAVVYAILQLSVNGFAGGWGFYSFRLAIEPMTLLFPLLVLGAREICRRPRWAWATAILVGYAIAVHTLGSSWYVNINEGKRWWVVYQPAEMTLQTPWHTVVAVAVGVLVTILLVGVARADVWSDRAAIANVDPDDSDELSAEPAAT